MRKVWQVWSRSALYRFAACWNLIVNKNSLIYASPQIFRLVLLSYFTTLSILSCCHLVSQVTQTFLNSNLHMLGLLLELQVVKKPCNIYKEPISKQFIETPDWTFRTSYWSCVVPVSGYVRCPDKETITRTDRGMSSQKRIFEYIRIVIPNIRIPFSVFVPISRI